MYTPTEEAYLFQIYSPLSNLINPSAEAQNLGTAIEMSKEVFKDLKNPDVTINPPRGPVRCPIRL